MDPTEAKLASEVRKQKYKYLLDVGARAMENSENSSVAENLEVLTDLVMQSTELITSGKIDDRVGQSSEVVLDAQVMKVAHDLMTSTVKKVESDIFDEDEFVGRLRRFLRTEDGDGLDFTKLDPTWCQTAKRFRFSSSLSGHMDFSREPVEPTQSTQRQRQQRRKMDVGEAKRPTVVKQQGNAPKYRKVDKIYEQIKAIYQSSGGIPISFYKLIIDPDNMMYTFDNSFQLSFLFRDGLITIETGEDGLPSVYPIERRKDATQEKEDTVSFCITLDQKIIMEHIKRYNITEPMLNVERDADDDGDEDAHSQ